MEVIIPLNEQGLPRRTPQPFPKWLLASHIALLVSVAIAYAVVS